MMENAALFLFGTWDFGGPGHLLRTSGEIRINWCQRWRYIVRPTTMTVCIFRIDFLGRLTITAVSGQGTRRRRRPGSSTFTAEERRERWWWWNAGRVGRRWWARARVFFDRVSSLYVSPQESRMKWAGALGGCCVRSGRGGGGGNWLRLWYVGR